MGDAKRIVGRRTQRITRARLEGMRGLASVYPSVRRSGEGGEGNEFQSAENEGRLVPVRLERSDRCLYLRCEFT